MYDIANVFDDKNDTMIENLIKYKDHYCLLSNFFNGKLSGNVPFLLISTKKIF